MIVFDTSCIGLVLCAGFTTLGNTFTVVSINVHVCHAEHSCAEDRSFSGATLATLQFEVETLQKPAAYPFLKVFIKSFKIHLGCC